jgi:hypothetical protein
MNSKTLVFSCIAALAIAGCYVPEKFAAKIDFDQNSSYTYQFSGTVANIMAAMEIKQSGRLASKDDADLRNYASKIAREPQVKSASYIGSGRYAIEMGGKIQPYKPLDILGVLTVTTNKNGITTIASPELTADGKKQLESIGVTINGTLDVTLPRNAEVIYQNADSTPSFFGLFGSYSWKIGSINQRPIMQIRIKR